MGDPCGKAFAKMFNQPELSDVTVVLKSDDSDEPVASWHAHKIILAGIFPPPLTLTGFFQVCAADSSWNSSITLFYVAIFWTLEGIEIRYSYLEFCSRRHRRRKYHHSISSLFILWYVFFRSLLCGVLSFFFFLPPVLCKMMQN